MPLPLLDESSIPTNMRFYGSSTDYKTRRAVLRDTVEKLSTPEKRRDYLETARKNHAAWKESSSMTLSKTVRVIAGDWGKVTQELSKLTGEIYAVLNMANAYKPGGGYREGHAAQEENIFRRTDCHFSITEDTVDGAYYTETMTRLINAEQGEVYLDSTPRVCIKDKEEPNTPDLGYADLAEHEYFLFYELRAAADNLNPKNKNDPPKPFDHQSMRRKIAAQLDTLIQHGIKQVVLSAFGCGAFRNPAEAVAQIYKEEIQQRAAHFEEIAFAIFHAGYGPDNFTPFKEILDGLSLERANTLKPSQLSVFPQKQSDDEEIKTAPESEQKSSP